MKERRCLQFLLLVLMMTVWYAVLKVMLFPSPVLVSILLFIDPMLLNIIGQLYTIDVGKNNDDWIYNNYILNDSLCRLSIGLVYYFVDPQVRIALMVQLNRHK